MVVKSLLKRTFILTGTLNHLICRKRNNWFGVYNKTNENLPCSVSIPAPYKQGSPDFPLRLFHWIWNVSVFGLENNAFMKWKKRIISISFHGFTLFCFGFHMFK